MSLYPRLLTLDSAKDHLGLPIDDESQDIRLGEKIEEATAIILDYLRTSDATVGVTWTAANIPPIPRAAIKLQLAELYRFTGDEADVPTHEPGQLSPFVTNLLRRYRDPVLS